MKDREDEVMVTLRVTRSQREALKSKAQAAGLSLQKYIVKRLEQFQSSDNPYLARELPRQKESEDEQGERLHGGREPL